MDKQKWLSDAAARGERLAAEQQKRVVDTLEEMLRHAKNGDMEYLLFNLGNLTGNAARCQQYKAQAASTKEALEVMNYQGE